MLSRNSRQLLTLGLTGGTASSDTNVPGRLSARRNHCQTSKGSREVSAHSPGAAGTATAPHRGRRGTQQTQLSFIGSRTCQPLSKPCPSTATTCWSRTCPPKSMTRLPSCGFSRANAERHIADFRRPLAVSSVVFKDNRRRPAAHNLLVRSGRLPIGVVIADAP